MRRERKPGYLLTREGRLITLEEWSVHTAGKRKRRKGHYMRYFSHWMGRHQSTKRQAARASRRDAKNPL